MSNFPNEWLDKNGFVKPQLSWEESGNGIYYSSVAVLLGYNLDYFGSLSKCRLEPGLYMRTPDNKFGNQQFDDYLGIAAACIKLGYKKIPKQIILYGITHALFLNTDEKLELKDFFGRFIQLWILMFIAAFPKLKLLAWPLAWIVGKTFKPFNGDGSGYQLQWVFSEACRVSGFNVFESTDLQICFEDYYGPNHPFNEN